MKVNIPIKQMYIVIGDTLSQFVYNTHMIEEMVDWLIGGEGWSPEGLATPLVSLND